MLPTKLDMAQDLAAILTEIDKVYPLWRFAYARPTEHQVARTKKPHSRIPLLWLAHFKSLREELAKQVRLVCNAPHHRLQESTRRPRLEQLRGKLSPRREEQVAEALQSGNANERIRQTTQRLSVDTPENRFVRAVLEHCDRELGRFQVRVREFIADPKHVGSLSSNATAELTKWRKGMANLLAQGLFREVGPAQWLRRESLVLQSRVGYSGVYRVWQQLRMYLEVFGRHATISMKTMAELYEIWCLLEVKRQLEALGFVTDEKRPPKLDHTGLEAQLAANGMGAAFRMQRKATDGSVTNLRLAHEPIFGGPTAALSPADDFVRGLNPQKPDIVVEVEFPNRDRLFWIFDAKYRLRHTGEPKPSDDNDDEPDDQSPPSAAPDDVPADAINQMHRYRDAIVRAHARDGATHRTLTRPVIGAFCLYPGWYPDTIQASTTNPYQQAITAVGIGAFPALPGHENLWLREYLASELGDPDEPRARSPGPEWQLARQPARIEPGGLRVSGPDLVFLAHIGGNRTPEYLHACRTGTAQWFHIRDTALVRGEIAASAMRDIGYCAVAYPNDAGTGSHITHLYVVVEPPTLGPRTAITADQAGIAASDHAGMYWLFRLGAAEPLAKPIAYNEAPQFRAWVTTLAALLAPSGCHP